MITTNSLVLFTLRTLVFTVHYYVNIVQVLYNDYYVLFIFIFPDVGTHTIRIYFIFVPPIFLSWRNGYVGHRTKITIILP